MGIPIQVIICVYMPYYDKSKPEQTDKYVECINALQCITDDYGDGVPIKILGDLNAQLPSEYVANNCDNWHKRKGYTSHSRIMQDFIMGNNVTVMDFMYNQRSKIHIF